MFLLNNYFLVLTLQIFASLIFVGTLCQISLHVKATVYGQFSLYLSIISALALFVMNWSNAALLRFGREEWYKYKTIGKVLATVFILYLFSFGIAVTLIYIFRLKIANFLGTAENFSVWVILGSILLSLSSIGVYAKQAMGRTLSLGYVQLICRSVFLVGIVVAFFYNIYVDLPYLTIIFLLGYALTNFVIFFTMPNSTWRRFRTDKIALKNILHYSWSIPFGGVAAYIIMWIDLWMIKVFLGAEQVGIYSWAYQFTSIGGLFFAPLNIILTPIMVDAHLSRGKEFITRYADVALRLVFLLSILGVFILPVIHPIFLKIVSQKYSGSYPIILVLLSLIPFQLLGYLSNPVLSLVADVIPKMQLINVCMALLNVVGDILLIPIYGIMGAAISTSFAFVFGAVSQFVLLKKTMSEAKMPKIWLFFLSCCTMMAGAILLLAIHTWQATVICFGFGFCLLFIGRYLGMFSLKDAEWLERQRINIILKTSLVNFARWLSINRY